MILFAIALCVLAFCGNINKGTADLVNVMVTGFLTFLGVMATFMTLGLALFAIDFFKTLKKDLMDEVKKVSWVGMKKEIDEKKSIRDKFIIPSKH